MFPWTSQSCRHEICLSSVVLTRFEQERDTVKIAKDVRVKLVSKAVQSWLENDSSPASKFSSIISNTNRWKNSDTNNEFGVEAIASLYKLNRTLSQLLKQWQSLCNYAVMYLSNTKLIKTKYRVIWHKIFVARIIFTGSIKY